MKKFNRRQFIGSIPALAMVSCYSSQKPDIILYNANIITVNPLQPKAEAIAISGDKIIAIGNNDEILNLASSITKKSILITKLLLLVLLMPIPTQHHRKISP